jgi:hypothetical protein
MSVENRIDRLANAVERCGCVSVSRYRHTSFEGDFAAAIHQPGCDLGTSDIDADS